FELTPEGIKREEDVDRSGSVAPVTGRKLDRAIIVFLTLALVLVLTERFYSAGDRPAPGAATQATTTAGEAETEDAAPAKSVAVLPFADLSQDGDQEWFADGLAEEILNALARTPDLLVASRTSSFGYKGTSKDILQIADELGVAHVLEGSVRSAGDRIRVTAQLIRAEDGFHVWSENYDRAPEDMIAIQEDLARSIAEALETTMDPKAFAAMAQVGTRSVEAYKAYLRGVAEAASVEDGVSVLTALEQFEAASQADPRFAAAYLRQAAWWKAQLTPSFILSGATDLGVDGLMDRFTAAVDLAIANAATEADRQGYLAQKAEVEVRLRDAIRLYETYLEQRPNDLPALLGYAGTAELAGDLSARQRVHTLLKERGKRDPEAAVWYLSSAYDDIDPNEVADYGLERLNDWPDQRGVLYQTHRALMWAGRTEEGASILRRYNLNFPEAPLMLMRQACIEGRREDAERALAAIERGEDDRWRTTAWLGLKILGRDSEAEPLLDPIADSSSPYQIASMLSYAIFDPQPHPELMTILDREGVLRPPPKDIPFKCPPPDETAIAVLPFVNMSSDPEQEYFSDGISEEILNALAQVPDLKVAGRTSSFAFKGRNEDLRTIGETLGVNHILEGSVRKAGDRVRITAQLIKAADGFHVWSETYDRELTDVFAIQDEIAAAILEELETRLAGDGPDDSRQVDIALYERFLRARELIRSRDESSIQRAADLLDSVIEADPNYAPAFAQRAIAELLLADQPSSYGSIPPREAATNASRFIDSALDLEPELVDAIAARGLAQATLGNLSGSEAELRRALTLNPNHINANNWLRNVLQDTNRLRDALRVAELTNELDPLYPPGVATLAGLYQTTGQTQKARPVLERALPYLDGGARTYVESNMAGVALWDQQEAEAIRISEALRDGAPPFARSNGFWAAFRLLDYERALTFAEDRALGILALARLGRFEEAMQKAQRFLSEGEGVSRAVRILAESGRHDDIIALYTSRFDSLDEFVQATAFSGLGANALGDLAYAYRSLGNQSGFERTVRKFREILELQAREGANNYVLSWSRAYLAMLEGDSNAALGHLEHAVDLGYLEANDFTRYWPVFQPLAGDPSLEALIVRMNERRNEQRALLDLPPIELDT
ncbi:MAG: hypothetical protein P8008_05345, partial [Gammaproteobacteria bacterium]